MAPSRPDRAVLKRIGKWRAVLVPILLLFSNTICCFSQPTDRSSNEYAVKAGFVVSFIRLTTFPNPDPDRLVVCVCGDDSVFAQFQSINGLKISDREATLIKSCKFQPNECDVLFVTRDNEGIQSALLSSVGNGGVLTIGETASFLAIGGTISLFEQDGKLKFAVNQTAAQKQGLRLSSQLLRLSREVTESEE